MIRQLSPVRIPCTECNLGYRRRHLADHMALQHPAPAPTRWARFAAWLRARVAALGRP